MWRPGQAKAEQSASASSAENADGKGRPTPSRKQAEAERKERLKASSSGATRKGRASSAAATRAERSATRKRIVAGDERVLAPRDRGPEKRYARDLVDSRHTVGEYFLYIAIAILILGIVPVPALRLVANAFLVLVVLGLIVDSVLIRRRVTRAVATKFPDGDLDGIARYAMMRGMVTRRMRVPKPQVKRGSAGSGRAA